MHDATAPGLPEQQKLPKAPVLLSAEDASVVQHLRQNYPLWSTEEVPHKACMAAVDLLFPMPDKNCGSSKGYRIQRLVAEAPEEVPAPSADPVPPIPPTPEPAEEATAETPLPAESSPEPPADEPEDDPGRPERSWPILIIAAASFIAIWSGWVGLGKMTGFGEVEPLPGIADWKLNTAIVLPITMEAYAAYAIRAWLNGRGAGRTRRFARNSAFGTIILGGLAQVAYHLLAAADVQKAPWVVTTIVACMPVLCLGTAAALHQMLSSDQKIYIQHQKKGQKK